MEFIDSTGHIFSLPSYEDNPINLEYVEGDYIFWMKESSVSINNYYIKPVRFLLDEKIIKDSFNEETNEMFFTLEISNSSQFYKLISPKYLQEQLEQSDNISKPVGLDKSQFVDKLTLDNFYFDLGGFVDLDGTIKEYDDKNLVVTSDKGNKFYMFPFYVVGYSDIEGTFLNNIMIKYSYGKDQIKIVTKEFSKDEYYDYTLKHSISPIRIYQWDKINDEYVNKTLVLTIKPTYRTEIIENSDDQDAINIGSNKYEILYNGDGIEKDPNNPISDNVLSSVYSEDDERQADQNKRIRSTKYNGELVIGQLPVEEYFYIYKLDHILPQGYYTFEGKFRESTSFLPLTTLPIPYMGFNYDGYRVGDLEDENDDLDSLYPEDENKVEITDKFMCGTLEILNPDIVTNKDNYITRENGKVKYSGYQISNEYYLNTPVKEFPQIRDFWFMFINKEINEGKNGKTIEDFKQTIKYKYYNYTPITVGCSFIDECEELIINGRNMGIRLPKEVLKAIYSSSFYSKNADEKLLKNKLKELLLNYMNIKGETGNLKSMMNSLKWFGWNKHINISQLIKTDNEFQNQFILDYFNIHNDIKETFKYFNRTNNISLTVLGNKEIGENYEQRYFVPSKNKRNIFEIYLEVKSILGNDNNNPIRKWYVNTQNNDFFINRKQINDEQFDNDLDLWLQYIINEIISVYNDTGVMPINDVDIYYGKDSNNNDIIEKYNLSIEQTSDEYILYGSKYESNVFIGEGKPKLEDLFAKNVEVVKEDITFYKPYYNFVFNELALKLDCLKYYYQQYFLPVHININRASIAHKVYANTTKMSSIGFTTMVDKPVYLPSVSDNIKVIFPDTDRLLFKQSNHIIDDKFNEFSNYNESNPQDLYYVNENCVTIPIKIENINNQYSLDPHGDYFIDDEGNYIKMNYFYKEVDDNGNAKLSNRFEATHFSIEKNEEDIQKLDDIGNRYVKISEGYFNCNLILTATIIEQNQSGHYIKIGDNKYIYKNKFYKSDFTEASSVAKENYIKYYDEYIKINPTQRYNIKTIYLLKDNHFNFYQSNDQYYMNFVMIPRLLNNTIDYENAYFRLSLLINNKWFNYDFRITTPNIYLDLGKLEYKYELTNGENNYYPFKQLRSLNPLKFNSFMYEPDLITINTLFKGKDDKGNDKLLTFLDKLLETGDDTHNPDQYKMYEFYKKYYLNVIRVPYNTKYYNRIHVFDIDIYDDNGNSKKSYDPDEDYTQLYKDFFGNNCNCKITLNENAPYDYYDYYLMHDDKEWYLVAISQYPIASYFDSDVLNIHKKEYPIKDENDNNIIKYNLKYNYSVDKFLVNRMTIKKANGYNQFNKDDLVVVWVNNNDYQFNIDLNNKWTIQPIYDVNNVYDVNSNTNLTIITNDNIDNLYTPGYYNVKLQYTINGLNNILHNAIAQYRILDKYQDIKYPEIIEPTIIEEVFNIKDTISDFTILYENNRGERFRSKDILDSNLGWEPIGIKVMNKYYYSPEQDKSIYIGLKWLTIKDPDNGFSDRGNLSAAYNPKIGFCGIDIVGLKNYSFIAYKDPEHTIKIGEKTYSGTIVPNTDTYSGQTENIWPQTDNIDNLTSSAKNSDGSPKWPAPNDRAYQVDSNSNRIINILNDDDTLNTSLLDEDCAAYDWNGKLNTQIMIDNFDEEDLEFTNWRTKSTIWNNSHYKKFSPAAACAWRYHTKTTNQGDWYLPSFAEILCLTYNFKRLTELFNNIAEKYPQCCKPDLLDYLNSPNGDQALWTSTEYNKNMMWEIHPNHHIHALGKTASWNAFPFIQIDD